MRKESAVSDSQDKRAYLEAVKATFEMIDAVQKHVFRHRGGGIVPAFPISVETPVGRIHFVQSVLRKMHGIEAEVIPSGRVGWGACFIFPNETMIFH